MRTHVIHLLRTYSSIEKNKKDVHLAHFNKSDFQGLQIMHTKTYDETNSWTP